MSSPYVRRLSDAAGQAVYYNMEQYISGHDRLYCPLDPAHDARCSLCAAAKVRLMWHAAPSVMRRLHSWGVLHPLIAALKTLGTQVQHMHCDQTSEVL